MFPGEVLERWLFLQQTELLMGNGVSDEYIYTYFLFSLQTDSKCYSYVSYFHVFIEQIKAPVKYTPIYPTLCS